MSVDREQIISRLMPLARMAGKQLANRADLIAYAMRVYGVSRSTAQTCVGHVELRLRGPDRS